MRVDLETGQTLTPEGLAAIEQRHDAKAALLAEMRAERAAQYGSQHSHVGAEIGRDIGQLADMQEPYAVLVQLSNRAFMQGHAIASRHFGALAEGILRAAHELYGRAGSEQLQGHVLAAASDQLPSKTLAAAVPQLSYDPSPEEIAEVAQQAADFMAADPVEAEALLGSVPEEMPFSVLGDDPAIVESIASELRQAGYAPVYQPDDDAGAALDELMSDMPGSDEPAMSPEPEDTPQRRAAAQRRAEKRAKGTQTP